MKMTVLSCAKEKKSLLSSKCHFCLVKVSSVHFFVHFFVLIHFQSWKCHFCPSKSQFCPQSLFFFRFLVSSCPCLILALYFIFFHFTTLTHIHEMHYPRPWQRFIRLNVITITSTLSYRSNIQLTPSPCQRSTSFVREIPYFVVVWEPWNKKRTGTPPP